nr:MAG TPA: hypothetical protein [Caudoviricetes sp.]
MIAIGIKPGLIGDAMRMARHLLHAQRRSSHSAGQSAG